ncbi:site-specific integrase [Methylosinus sp. LW4]|uniref:site-specific integrase n=1 Tax=Methylosinus sp. LW4 TaxID=136993 RepID=UPI00039D7B8E|nr:site-specific integrase [Methylosinus sp. LW4]
MTKYHIPYVERVGSDVYHYRRDVPEDVQAILKRKRWSKSLKTTNMWEAAEPARRLKAQHDAQIEAARGVLNLSGPERERIDSAGGVDGFLRFLEDRSREADKLASRAQDVREWAAVDGPADEIPDSDWARTEVETMEARAESIRRHLSREAPLVEKVSRLNPIKAGSALAVAMENLPPVEETATVLAIAEKKAARLFNKSQYMEPAKVFVALHGDVVMSQITEAMVRKFRDHMAANVKNEQGEGRWEASTAKKHYGAFKTICKFAKSEGYSPRNPAIEIEWVAEKVKFRVARKKKRLTFSIDQVKSILAECDKLPLNNHKKLDLYWFTRLMLWTGARPEELAQLVPDNIVEIVGIPCVQINDALPHQKIKTANAERDVPIHRTLIEDGFLDFVKARKAQKLLFSTLKADKRGRFYPNMRKRLLHLLRVKVGLTDSRIVPYSCRHTFIDCLRTVRTPEPVEDRIVGHATKGRGVHDGYGTAQTVVMNEWLQQVDPLKEGRRVREFDDDGGDEA